MPRFGVCFSGDLHQAAKIHFASPALGPAAPRAPHDRSRGASKRTPESKGNSVKPVRVGRRRSLKTGRGAIGGIWLGAKKKKGTTFALAALTAGILSRSFSRFPRAVITPRASPALPGPFVILRVFPEENL